MFGIKFDIVGRQGSCQPWNKRIHGGFICSLNRSLYKLIQVHSPRVPSPELLHGGLYERDETRVVWL